MKIENTFRVPIAPDDAWLLLLDVPKIAPCLPGARLTESLPDETYKGEAVVKIGPVQFNFAGQAQLVNVDTDSHTAQVIAKGADARGRGNASATVDFALKPDGDGTRVDIVTDLSLAGSVAQYGRASGLVKNIAAELIGQFAKNLERLIAEGPIEDETAKQNRISGLKLLWSASKRMISRNKE